MRLERERLYHTPLLLRLYHTPLLLRLYHTPLHLHLFRAVRFFSLGVKLNFAPPSVTQRITQEVRLILPSTSCVV